MNTTLHLIADQKEHKLHKYIEVRGLRSVEDLIDIILGKKKPKAIIITEESAAGTGIKKIPVVQDPLKGSA